MAVHHDLLCQFLDSMILYLLVLHNESHSGHLEKMEDELIQVYNDRIFRQDHKLTRFINAHPKRYRSNNDIQLISNELFMNLSTLMILTLSMVVIPIDLVV